jgi:hypothetical protein
MRLGGIGLTDPRFGGSECRRLRGQQATGRRARRGRFRSRLVLGGAAGPPYSSPLFERLTEHADGVAGHAGGDQCPRRGCQIGAARRGHGAGRSGKVEFRKAVRGSGGRVEAVQVWMRVGHGVTRSS